MTRIIAGEFGGRTLATPRGADTRPTTDRVREAIFSRIESLFDLTGARVLDLYAGSGALGLEAVSRGGESVLLVEADRRTARLIENNVSELGLRGARVRAEKVDRVLERGPGGEAFDLVLLDPPYPLGEENLAHTLGLLVAQDWLSRDALVVVERSARSPEPTWPEGLSAIRSRTYGETAIHLAEPSGDPDESDPAPDASPASTGS
ncbi:16S rRNA (guanine(966)-N(2))-methyltransferase RsmD [Ornithinimicrobium ciconiae]|uniref:16S rRNA (Guanine(966)-N(2))-methyltransferase RsmD n=1 Tax=Ornithinimicrobium ciconiae TaxID=2594265 RepID=A0A516GCB4_9MICO|nr:16S rRNA (guanine(966)-N(2))-methyltransferase RsmD [Ornithinimicrobium ciconiae]QDO89164.1 16S rRNA (guanine(966)-N(2))-methyltransferase RsmD [Ornithinimicrobium ciconiae]